MNINVYVEDQHLRSDIHKRKQQRLDFYPS